MQDQELAAVDLADVDALKFEVRESRGELGRWQRGEKKRLQLGLAVPVSHFFKCATRLKYNLEKTRRIIRENNKHLVPRPFTANNNDKKSINISWFARISFLRILMQKIPFETNSTTFINFLQTSLEICAKIQIH